MRFSIVTPSFRQSDWLRLCVASVADQGVPLEHLVQDGGSDDGTLDWLSKDPRVKACSGKDDGMYDAVNRGLRRAQGEILAYLNCDEQYLPGTLQFVDRFFREHPETDLLFGDTVVLDGRGDYLCHRLALPPTKYHTLVSGNLSILTCSTFFQRRVLDAHGLFFDPSFRAVGDAEWISRVLQKRLSMAAVRQFTSAFTETSVNLGLQPAALAELGRFTRSAPLWSRALRVPIVALYRVRKLLGGLYRTRPLEYAVYTQASPEKRIAHSISRSTPFWPKRG